MGSQIKLAIASDLSGLPLKRALVEHLNKRTDLELSDFGIPSEEQSRPYYELASLVARAIQEGRVERGVLVCGTGQGMAIVANKHKGVYACVADGLFSAERGRIVNNANVLTLGGWITAPFMGTQIVDAWLAVDFCEKMEFKREWLTEAFHQVQRIEEESFKTP